MHKDEPPAVFGPGRSSRLDRVAAILAGVGYAAILLWVFAFGDRRSFLSTWPPGGLDLVAIGIAGLVVPVFFVLAMLPYTPVIIEVGGHGVSTAATGLRAKPRTTLAFDMIDRIELQISKDDIVTIIARPGSDREKFRFKARLQANAPGATIVQEIVRRARTARVDVRGPEMHGVFGTLTVWRFSPSGNKDV